MKFEYLILKFDFLESEKSFCSEIKSFSQVSPVLCFRFKNKLVRM